MKRLFVFPAIAIALSFAACGGSENKNTSTTTEETTTTGSGSATTETVPGIENVELSNKLVVEGNDQMKFDKELLRVKAGEEVELTLKNVGELPKESMGHNFVVLAPGVDVATFGGEAVAAADNDYIPKTSLSSVVAHTRLLGPGEEDTITFTLEKGVYTYICSFPGHFGVMQGKIVAE
ncbi:plastocyanin/azurin family copper-binding protein [Sphingobacterium sp. SGR-19]|uniref:plastocyanin/azurin family copper-binding protein n=1 Tax=Sphingobacterium sp. SGR-19 TaxID=2710886 RepID=UPI0013E9BD6B|nr:azurin [Sphingobacterium sp. SGR-19]NGM64730.1 azurin [Sphingobacterium sp. SGR-19]